MKKNFYYLIAGAMLLAGCDKENGELSDGKDFTETKISGVEFKMVYVKGGTFTMGATEEQEDDADDDEYPTHKVTLSDYYIGEFEVTQGLWEAVMGDNPSYFDRGEDYPVEEVSWEDAQEFCAKLSRKTGRTYALPTEAQWEFAARGGVKSKGYKYSGSDNIKDVAWYGWDDDSDSDGNSGDRTHAVGTKRPNELGIYDMSGNVWEWCEDWYGNYKSKAQTDPEGPTTGSSRVLRGGSWDYFAWRCRVSIRDYFYPVNRNGSGGFRLVLVR